MRNSLLSLSTDQLRQALALREKIEALERDLETIVGGASLTNGHQDSMNWTESAAARTGIETGNGSKPRRRLSASAKAKIAAVARRRWAQAKAQGRNAL